MPIIMVMGATAPARSPRPDQTPIMPDVSVVIPCYNGLPYLPEALDSALAQSHKPVEVIVVDDGSKDGSADFVRDYAAKHPDGNIRVIQQPNGGEPVARNTGIQASRGEWVAQLDTDDWWEPTKLEKQLAAAAAAGPDCVLVHTAVMAHYPDGKTLAAKTDGPASRRVGRCTEALLADGSIGHPSILVRRDALAQIHGYNPEFKQACDIDLYFRLSAVGSFAYVPEHLLHYRYHAKQMSASQIKQIGFHHRAIREFFASHPDIEARIGKDRVTEAMASHVAIKLESLYWKRRLPEFRELLAYAKEQGLDNEAIRKWRRRARVPDWVVRVKDKLSTPTDFPRGASAAGGAGATGGADGGGRG